MSRLFILLLPCLLGWMAAPLRGAEPLQPYQADESTLHLWHLDEPGPPFANAVDGGTPLRGLFNGARAGQPAMPGFGRSVSFNANVGGTPGTSDAQGAILLASRELGIGGADNAPAGFKYFGPDGAFTYEMMVKLDMLPRESPFIALDLLTMEGDGEDRIFTFRIEKDGFLVFVPLPHCGASGGAIATLPTSGPNQPDTQHWFHVAVTYNGNAGAPNNLKLYWTRIGGGASVANHIGSGTLSNDFNGVLGDFAIGNEARGFANNAEAEPFPGLIDEVRISGVARRSTDFFFIPPALRGISSKTATGDSPPKDPPELRLNLFDVLVDANPARQVKAGGLLELGAGLHRLDFDFGFRADEPTEIDGWPEGSDAKLRCQLVGIEDQWRDSQVGMGLLCQALDESGQVISQSRFPVTGRSEGWKSTLEDSSMTRRSEPVYLPEAAVKLRLILNSGPPDTTGFLVIESFSLKAGGADSPSLIQNGDFIYNAYTTSPAGSPDGWKRGGWDPSIARMILRANKPGIGLVDGDQTKFGEWTMEQFLPVSGRKPGVYTLSWSEAYNVIGGGTHRATYTNVPPGDYEFRVLGLAGGEGESLSVRIKIHPPFWMKPWFWPAVSACGVALIAGILFSRHRQRAKRSLERLKFQNALEKDRARIARDMHDDLGSRVTFLNMSASLAQRELANSPEKARRHLNRMAESARELIVAMDGLVWAVDPAHDTVEHLAFHLGRLAEEMFRDSSVRCRLEIPPVLPSLPVRSEVRHHVALAVKESFNNILRHAGPCEAFFTFAFEHGEIRITIRDTGRGFDPESVGKGHGLDNLASRFKEIGGICRISSSPGEGTRTVLSCPVTANRAGKKS